MQLETSFSPSPLTVGAELELQIIDPATGDLAPGAVRILTACKDAQIEGVSGEFLLSMLEVKSAPCQNVAELRDNLFPRLRAVRNVASSLGFELALGGTHPFARPSMSAVFPDERYQRIMERQGWMAYRDAIFGLHVHVGVPDGDAAIGVVNRSVEYLPHLLALSANSPYWQAEDTSYVSARMRMFRPSAGAGLPLHFANWQGYCDYCAAMNEAGLIETPKDIYWDIRPSPKFGTVEFRIFDVPSTLASVLGLTALTRCLVAKQLRELADHPELAAGDQKSYWLANENKWLATRYGLETRCMRAPGGERQSIATDLAQLLMDLQPIAEEIGETEHLEHITPERGLEIGADRQRLIFRDTGDWKAVVDDMSSRWVQEIDDSHLAHASGAAPVRSA